VSAAIATVTRAAAERKILTCGLTRCGPS